MAERPRKLGDFKGVGHFEATFLVKGLRFAPIYLAVAYQLQTYSYVPRNNMITSLWPCDSINSD